MPQFYAINDNKMWSDDETILLLDIWGSDEIQQKLSTIKRNRLVWEEVARLMTARGFRRSAKQCCGKIHNLKVEFRKVKTQKKYNNFKFFDVMEPLMVGDITLANAEKIDGQDYRSQPISAASTTMRHESIDLSNGMIGEGDSQDNYDAAIGFMPAMGTMQEAVSYHQSQFTENGLLRSVKVENETSTDGDAEGPNIEIHEGSNAPSPVGFAAKNNDKTPTPITDRANRPRKRRHTCRGAGSVDVEVVFEKLRQMQEESDKRFYEWEEKRLRLEREFEERRQQLESERESRRERFLIQLVSMLQRNEKAAELIDNFNRSGAVGNGNRSGAIGNGIPRIQTVVGNNAAAAGRNRNGDIYGQTTNRSKNGNL